MLVIHFSYKHVPGNRQPPFTPHQLHFALVSNALAPADPIGQEQAHAPDIILRKEADSVTGAPCGPVSSARTAASEYHSGSLQSSGRYPV